MAEVVLENVCKEYEAGARAVDRFSLTIRDSEFLVLVGPSGCGKSTTLRMIAGLEEISSGTVSIGGRCVNAVPPKDRDIAMVFQNYALYPHMTVYDNMAFGLKLRGVPRREIEARVRGAADILGLGELLKRLPKQLSGGQRQRVAVGRAIVRQPKVFLFDEPLSNLDAKMRVEMRGELTRLHRRLNATMVYVTHDQAEAMTMGDRIVVMDRGAIQQAAPPLEVYRRPANLFVAGFIGTPPMNVLRDVAPEDFGLGGGGRLPGRVHVGFRPEAVRAGEGAPASAVRLRGVIDMVEPMGAETFVQVAMAGGARFTARVPGDWRGAPGEEAAFALDARQAHLFDRETGAALAAGGPGEPGPRGGEA
ncbi:MAG: sn-glycerol-3-phosphate ABC transporter ATP-binding protein UgpC [Verrucomicrobiota bacterium]|jgi:multiple sugar transport system ATP-binding protein|nr:sn-glycerol-3-phosphate ABC transporter ATP-binding protein UgpC [Verrucomicrobiota bacterium]